MKTLKDIIRDTNIPTVLYESSLLDEIEKTLSVTDPYFETAMSSLKRTRRTYIGYIVQFLDEYVNPGKILIDDAEQTIKDFSNDYGEDDQDVLNVFRYCYNIAKTCSEHRDSWVSCFLTIFAGYNLESFEKEINDIGQTEKWYKGLTSKQLDLLKYINRENIRIPEKYIDNLKNLKKWYFGYNDSDEIQIYGIPKYLSKEQEKFIETLVKRRKR